MNNTAIASNFSLLAKLMDIHGENSFKSKTYAIAAFHIEKLDEPLSAMDRLQLSNIKGIGESAVNKIIEQVETGKLAVLEDIISNTPPGVIEILNIKGLGPKKIHTIWKEMGIASIGELEYACNENRLTRYKGFGAKTQQNVLESIKFYTQNIGHFLYAQVAEVFEPVRFYLEKLFGKEKVLLTGDYRRQALTIEKLEFIIDDSNENIKPKFKSAYPPELLEETNHSLLYKLNNGLKLLLYTNEKNIFKKQFLTSGSDLFINSFFESCNKEDFNHTNFTSEKEIFDSANTPFILPCLRETATIIAKACSGQISALIQVSDIKGIIHNHSNWSDGATTIEEMAMAVINKGFEYLVISDHSKTAAYANGLSEEKILQQHAYIDSLNKKLTPFKIFKSIESDILNDGSLDYADDVLNSFDLVIASIHSNLFMKEEKAMARLMKAIENPYTTILAHPTGRLLLSRNGYPINHKLIIDACIKNNVVIEINANPRRLDLDWRWIDYAVNKGAVLSINPDAHSIEGLNDIAYGVLAAQKGMLTPGNNLSSYSLTAFEEFINNRRKQIKR